MITPSIPTGMSKPVVDVSAAPLDVGWHEGGGGTRSDAGGQVATAKGTKRNLIRRD